MSEYRALDSTSVFLVYGVLAALCLTADRLWGGSFIDSWASISPLPTGALIAGLIFIIVYIVVSTLFGSLFSWGVELERVFQQILTPLSYFQILLLALLSGFIEEWFFRGVLLSYFGLFVSAIAFGLAHLLPAPRLWIWSLWTLGAGLLLGWMQLKFQNLWLVAGIHSAINFFLLLKLNLRAHRVATRARL